MITLRRAEIYQADVSDISTMKDASVTFTRGKRRRKNTSNKNSKSISRRKNN